MKQTLGMQVAAAIGGMLVGREVITLGEVEEALPGHLLAGRPSHRSMTKAFAAAGWTAQREAGGRTVFRAPRGADDVAGEGHNRPAAGEELAALVERVERLREERRELLGAERDVIKEAKSLGYDPAAVRRLVSIRGKDREDWHAGEAILETYLRALGMVSE